MSNQKQIKMDKVHNCPLDEIGKLGEMLIRNSIEKGRKLLNNYCLN